MFSLSKTTGYTILALSHLTEAEEGWTLARDIASEAGISQPYLSKILNRLGHTGLIRAKRGYQGGFALSRPAREINLLDIILAIEGEDCFPSCFLGLPQCTCAGRCPTHGFWKAENRRIQTKLRKLTLADVSSHMRCAMRKRAGGRNR